MKINWLKKISNKNHHDAFTDINRLNNHLYLCFRRATTHHSHDGAVILQQLNLHGKCLQEHKFTLNNSDLRDPKITITNNNTLILCAYARRKIVDERGIEKTISRNTFWRSLDGNDWQHEGYFAAPFHWCWRLTVFAKQIYSIAYQRKTESLYLYRGNDLKNVHPNAQPIMSKATHNLGYPNESDLCFIGPEEQAQGIAIVRRDADTYTSQIGRSVGDFTDWQWQELPIYLASPKVLCVRKDELLIAARYEHNSKTPLPANGEQFIQYYGCGEEKLEYQNDALKTGLFSYNLVTHELTLLLALPSADDNGYPGLVRNNEALFLSYYSTSGPKKTQVYVLSLID